MKTRWGKIALSVLLTTALAVSLIPIKDNLNAYAETTTPDVTFALPVTSASEVPDGYVGIYTKADLDNIRVNLSGNYILMNDIVFAPGDFASDGDYYNGGAGWDPIGEVDFNYPETGEAFTGILDGNGYRISGLFIDLEGQSSSEDVFAGLFAAITGSVKNLGLTDLDIAAGAVSPAKAEAGGIAAWAPFGGSVYNCYATGQIQAKSSAGGLVGLGEDCNIQLSKNLCAVTAGDAGGIVGSYGATVVNCMNGGDITASYAAGGIGGSLMGEESTSVVARSCFNTGTVTSARYAGGIVGVGGSVSACFNTGEISSTGENGASAGIAASGHGTINQCYNTGKISLSSGDDLSQAGICTKGFYPVTDCYYLKGCCGHGVGIVLTDTQMKSQSSFAGFDFSQKWTMNSQIKRPVLTGISPDIYDIQYNLAGGVLPSNTAMAYMTGSCNKLTVPSKTGYAFKGWYEDLAYSGSPVTTIPGSAFDDVAYYAKWGAPLVSAASYNYNSIRIAWDPAGGATAYRIYRATSSTGPYTMVYKASGSAKAWIDSGRVTGKYYYYKVFPVSDGKIYSFKTVKQAKPRPATPTAKAAVYNATSIKVSWSGVAGATKYQVCRRSSLDGSLTSVYVGPSTARSFIDRGLVAGQMYYYQVRVYHLEGTSKVYGEYSEVIPVHMQL